MSMELEIAIVNYMKKKDNRLDEFFYKIVENFANEELNTYKLWRQFHFVFNERCAMSALIPAIHKVTGNIWLEEPFKNLKENNRRVDILTEYNKRNFFIEVKHFFHRNANVSLYGYAKKRLNKTMIQISDITKDSLKDLYQNLGYSYKIAFIIAPTFLSNKSKNGFNQEILNKSAEEYAQGLYDACCNGECETNKPSYVITWKLNDPINYQNRIGEIIEIYPFVNFIIKVEKIS